ncbi:MAG: creatininase family protein [Abditibacteriales bacterium]|nr:creatininase family protein [Abditibacteriales bacterium]MDW8366461.1 creatininase family protein [Abditibacteriales bacterium]
MPEREVMLNKLTRREFREALAAGKFKAAIIPVGSIEQHLEHLAMEHDIASSTHVAREAALRLYPQVVVAVPMAIGISEHHMMHPGSLTAKPGSWLAVLFDAVESLVRHGLKNVLILNGHGGNVAPVNGVLNQWKRYFAAMYPGTNLHFHSYWDLIPRAVANAVLDTDRMPGHAQEFETAFALAVFPENVRHDAMHDQEDKDPTHATVEKGQQLVEEAVTRVAEFVQGMIEGQHVAQITGL